MTAGEARRLDAWTTRRDPDVVLNRDRRAMRRRGITVSTRRNTDGLYCHSLALTDAANAVFLAAVEPLARRTGVDDDRTRAQRLHDALATLCQQACDRGQLPAVAAQRPHQLLVRTIDTNGDDTDAPRLDGIGPVSTATADLIGCDADTTLITRDTTCVGCGPPPARCHLHHIQWRRHGGTTVIDNLVLVFRPCHNGIHHLDWTITGDPTPATASTATPRQAPQSAPPHHDIPPDPTTPAAPAPPCTNTHHPAQPTGTASLATAPAATATRTMTTPQEKPAGGSPRRRGRRPA